MNARTKKILILAGVISLVCFVTSVFAQPFEDTPKEFGEERKQAIENFTEELELTQEQQEQIKEQRAEKRKQAERIREQLKAKNQELRQELEKEEVDEVKVQVLIAEINDLQAKQLQQRVEGVLKMKEILTPEQHEKLKAKMQEKKQKMHHKRGKMMRHNFEEGE
ncbi:MAG: periplasmic heavy metal sensor [Candidatus Omnitrophota bacterium]